MATIVGLVSLLAALILAWRGYRSAAADHEARKRDREQGRNDHER